ncbi:hypothetical protein BRAS3843_660100 [Bradyrhizobium sp. STM 3843]|nr:hypothetical protein BRAS3843_660100 [Bradyrhizobium sp. STM 3843]
MDRMLGQRLQQNGRAELVGADVVVDVVHALADADHCGEVQNHIGSAQCAFDSEGISDISDNEFGVLAQVAGPVAFGPMNLRREIIEDPNIISRAEQLIGGVRADEPSSSGNQDSCHSPALLSQVEMISDRSTTLGCRDPEADSPHA